MNYIILSSEQVEIVAVAQGDLEVRDSSGKYIGCLTRGFTVEEIAEAKRRIASNDPRYTTQQVLARLQTSAPK